MKLIIRVSGCRSTGYEGFLFRQDRCQVDARFADLKHLVCSITLSDQQTTVDQLLRLSIVPYPLGVPLLVPGERVEEYHVQFIIYLMEKGGDIIGVDDLSMNTIQVLGE